MKRSIDLIVLLRKFKFLVNNFLTLYSSDRSVTPQAGLRRVGTPSTASGPNSASLGDQQRLSAPTKSIKKLPWTH